MNSQQPRLIENWLVTSGNLHGDVNGQPLTTSHAVKRDGRIVTTRSGSLYELGNCNPAYDDQFWIDKIDAWILMNESNDVIADNPKNHDRQSEAFVLAAIVLAVLVSLVAVFAIVSKHRKVALPNDPSSVPTIELAEAGEQLEPQAQSIESEQSTDEATDQSINVGRVPRSGKWAGVRRDWLLQYPCCEACGRESMSNHVHHRYPFHKHPEWELLDYLPDGRRQFVTVCAEHHFLICHDPDGPDGPKPANWSQANEDCIEDCATHRKRYAKSKWDVAPAIASPTLAPPLP